MVAQIIVRHLLYESLYKTPFEHLSQGQLQACQIVLRIASALSMCGSGFIIYHLMGPRWESETKTNLLSRFLLGLCVSDFFSSVALFMGAWLIPQDSSDADQAPGHIFHGNSGTQLTCNMQGFALQVFYFSYFTRQV